MAVTQRVKITIRRKGIVAARGTGARTRRGKSRRRR